MFVERYVHGLTLLWECSGLENLRRTRESVGKHHTSVGTHQHYTQNLDCTRTPDVQELVITENHQNLRLTQKYEGYLFLHNQGQPLQSLPSWDQGGDMRMIR